MFVVVHNMQAGRCKHTYTHAGCLLWPFQTCFTFQVPGWQWCDNGDSAALTAIALLAVYPLPQALLVSVAAVMLSKQAGPHLPSQSLRCNMQQT